MNVTRINIPSRPATAAADIVIATIQGHGMDARKAASNPMMRQIVLSWTRGEMDDAAFARSCANMLILNPTLAL